jgi:GTP-dependent dephospho-CoA kinase
VLILKKETRSELKKPFGKLYLSLKDPKEYLQKLKKENKLIISIGDATTINLQREGITPDMGVIDNKIERKNSIYKNEVIYADFQLKTENPPGTITPHLWNTMEKGFQLIETPGHQVLIVVEGEEDLAVIPAVILAPPGAVILYGQPGEGVVLCEVDKMKKKAEKLIEKFEEA